MKDRTCVTLIGMPGSGKSTIGRMLAGRLNYAFIDTDTVLEALYARPLQMITDALPRDVFLDAEADVICAIQARECVIATGGSVIYRKAAMLNLRRLGPVVYLNPPLEAIERRVACKPDRGISFGPGQRLEDLHTERAPMYEKYADFTCNTDCASASECARFIAARVKTETGCKE